ncbi:CLUMA_CG006142, isoform A [Clunio marinus]|uniref:CLUMA_CG006142, isoform A n=1 Tax=Clunio marinus TaxID=568069 RepID=A0A1J1I2H6_9DIPT|nr:CLUMA_CG006142, isoform A [Clunio marinus]
MMLGLGRAFLIMECERNNYKIRFPFLVKRCGKNDNFQWGMMVMWIEMKILFNQLLLQKQLKF